MKLLLDENLSRRIVPFLQSLYPGSSHVVFEGLERADDAEIWQYAGTGGFTIVTKDSDFQELSLVQGAPPKVVWLRAGNTTKANVLRLLTESREEIEDGIAEDDVNCVELG
jgi:predicted nuclease of predicted toxin-antitoxin system